jgi:hypothetical protein
VSEGQKNGLLGTVPDGARVDSGTVRSSLRVESDDVEGKWEVMGCGPCLNGGVDGGDSGTIKCRVYLDGDIVGTVGVSKLLCFILVSRSWRLLWRSMYAPSSSSSTPKGIFADYDAADVS